MAKARASLLQPKGKKTKLRMTSAMKDVNLLRQFGPPPAFKLNDVDDPEYNTDYAAALNWCNAALDNKAGRTELILWLEQNTDYSKSDRQAINGLVDWKLLVEGKIAYLANNGWPLLERSFIFLNNGVEKCLDEARAFAALKVKLKAEAIPTASVAVQNSLDSLNLRSVVEDMIFPGLSDKAYDQDKMITLIKGVKAVVTDVAVVHLQVMLDEINLIGEDEQVTEGYAHLAKKQIKQIKEDFGSAITLLRNNRLNAKAVNAGRKKKPRSAMAQTLKFKFKEKDDALGIVSAKPAELIGAKKVTIFNTKTRKIGIYVALDDELGFTAKGTTLLGFDKDLSQQKTLRKTKTVSIVDHLNKFRKAAVRKVDKVFEGLSTTGTKLTGRFNGDMIILKVYK